MTTGLIGILTFIGLAVFGFAALLAGFYIADNVKWFQRDPLEESFKKMAEEDER